MSSPLAIAAVTALLQDVLNNALIDRDVATAVNTNVVVSAKPPDRVVTSPNEPTQLNLFLYNVTPNAAWRNVDLPARDERGNRTSFPPLAVDLHYLLTAYGGQDRQAEVLLGYGMYVLHEVSVLSRADIREALRPVSPVDGGILPATQNPLFAGLTATDLADQVEQIKVCPEYLGIDDMSKLWAAFQTHYRPSMGYQVSVVLIDLPRPRTSPLPVLSIGPRDAASGRDEGVSVIPGLVPPFPEITAVQLPGAHQVGANLGDTIGLVGHHLLGVSGSPTSLEVRLTNARLGIFELVATNAGAAPGVVAFDWPTNSLSTPPGVYTLALAITEPDPSDPNGPPVVRTTNECPIQLAPRILSSANSPSGPVVAQVPRTAVNAITDLGNIILNITCESEMRPGQQIALLLGSRSVPADPITSPSTDTANFRVTQIRAGTYRVRLRVDGVETPLIVWSSPQPGMAEVPHFDETQRIIVT